MLIDRAGIAALIPHQGAMCLLDGVLAWDAGSIRCVALSHREPGNPLSVAGELPVLCGVEYAGQAMALHGSLAAGGRGRRAGYLASLRDLAWRRARLDDVAEELIVEAALLAEEASSAIYRFALSAAGEELLWGRAAIARAAGRP